MQRLAKVVAEIHQRHEQQQSYDGRTDSSRFQLVNPPENDSFWLKESNFLTYRDPAEKSRHIPNSRRSRLVSDERDESLSRKVDLELIKFEQNRKLQVEKSVLQRKERLTRLIENLRSDLMTKSIL